MTKNVKLVGLAHSKLRNAIGAVGIEVDVDKLEVIVKLVRHWDRSQINDIAAELGELWHKHEWDNTIIDLRVGSSVIDGLKRYTDIPTKIIYIKKKVDDISEIRRVKSLDLIEMVQFLLQLKLAHKMVFPTNPTKQAQELESQIALYSEHTTEAGGIDYYSPGEELDNLTKALMVATFAARPMLNDSVEIVCGPLIHKQPTGLDQLSDAINA